MGNNSILARLTSWGSTAPVEAVNSKRVRVFLMDMLSIVPYYTGHLCAKLQEIEAIDLTVGAIPYGYDKTFFQRMGVRTDFMLMNLSARLSSGIAIRRPLKAIECLWNLIFLAGRFLFHKPDIIHVQFLPLITLGMPFEIWFLRLMKLLGVKVVYTVHNVVPHERARRDTYMYSRMYELADRLICHDMPARNRLTAEFHVNPAKIEIIPHGPLFQPRGKATDTKARRVLELPADRCVVLFQGIIRPYKGVPFLLTAWRKALDSGFRGVLVIVGTGDPEQLTEIRQCVDDLELKSSVKLIFRFVPIDELDNYYKAADILVYPYSAVTTSGALMTGIGYAKPIIATALPAFYEILHHEDNALIVGYGHVEGLAEALLRLGNDSVLRAALAKRLQSMSAVIPNWSEIANQTAACYAAALAHQNA